eukprot:COSAG01_NODE_16803_length_1202_cov_22.793291_2_plen_77_part_00
MAVLWALLTPSKLQQVELAAGALTKAIVELNFKNMIDNIYVCRECHRSVRGRHLPHAYGPNSQNFQNFRKWTENEE